jgi:dCMP deaminase
MRITRPQMFMEIAQVVAKRSTCMRLNVGAVLVEGRSIVSIGYNGAPAGQPHCGGNQCPGKHFCQVTDHAEENALKHLPAEFDGSNLDLYVTDSPCASCTALILHDGRVSRIFFETPYRINEHLKDLIGIEVYKVTPAGYVMNWSTGELVDVAT